MLIIFLKSISIQRNVIGNILFGNKNLGTEILMNPENTISARSLKDYILHDSIYMKCLE
jgi:hypothetical protein